MWKKDFSAFGACHILCIYGYVCTCCSTCAPYTLSCRPPCPNARCQLSVYFNSPAQPSPSAKHKAVIDALLCFTFKHRTTSRKRQEAYNEAQKACPTLFLSVPMATLCEFVAVAQKMATRNREVRCLPHEFHAAVCARLNMLMMEQLLIIAHDCAPWAEYDVSAVAAGFWKTRRVHNLRGRRKDKSTKRRKTDVSDAEVPFGTESVDDEALPDNLSYFV